MPDLTAVTAFGREKTSAQKKHFPVKNKPVSVTKRLLFTSKLAFYSYLEVFRATKWSKNLIFLSFIVSEHPPNPQLQGLKIDLSGYRRPNYFSRSVPGKPHVLKARRQFTQ